MKPDLIVDGEARRIGADPETQISDTEISRIADAVIEKLQASAWERLTSSMAVHEGTPSIKNKAKVAAAFNQWALIFGGDAV